MRSVMKIFTCATVELRGAMFKAASRQTGQAGKPGRSAKPGRPAKPRPFRQNPAGPANVAGHQAYSIPPQEASI